MGVSLMITKFDPTTFMRTLYYNKCLDLKNQFVEQ